MKKKMAIAVLGMSLLALASCASSRSTRAMRKAERMMARQERQAKKEYEKAKTAHFERQAPKTKEMIKDDRRRARETNRHLRRY